MSKVLLIPVITMTAWLIYVRVRYEMTESISKTYMVITKAWEQMWFVLTLWSVALPVMAVGLEMTFVEQKSGILFFLAGTGIALVGAAPAFWLTKHEYWAHMIGSYGGIGFGIISCFIYFNDFLTFLICGAYSAFVVTQFLFKKLRINNYIYWVEVFALLTVVSVLYINSL